MHRLFLLLLRLFFGTETMRKQTNKQTNKQKNNAPDRNPGVPSFCLVWFGFVFCLFFFTAITEFCRSEWEKRWG